MVRFLMLAGYVAVASSFSVPALRAPVSVPVRSAGVVMMPAPVEEKKGPFAGLFGNKQVEGKVVPTGKGDEEELSESKKLLQQVKDAGVAGIIS